MFKSSLVMLVLVFSFTSNAVEKEDVSKMVKQFVDSGLIPKEEAVKVQRGVAELSPEQWKQIEATAQAYQQQMKSPNVGNSLGSAVHNVDTNSTDFKNVMKDVEAIMKKRQNLIQE